MSKIKLYGINRLRNHHFPRAYKRIVSQLNGEEFEVDDVQVAYDILVSHSEEVAKIKNADAHDLTEEINNLRDMRHQYILSMRGRIVYFQKSPFAAERAAAHALFKWIEKEHEFVRSVSINTQARSIDKLEIGLMENPKLNVHLTTLALTELFESIVEATSEIDMNLKVRIDDQITTKKQNIVLRRIAYKALRVFIVAIEQAIELNKGDINKHEEYLSGIKKVVTNFTSQYDSMATRKQNAKIEAEAKAKAAAKAAAEADKNANHENGEQGGADVKPMGGKLVVTAGRSKPFSPKVLDDMDLQQDGDLANVAMRSAAAMSDNANVTSGEKPDGDDEKEVIDPTAGASGMREDVGNEAVNKSPGDDAAISE